jgi:uncharacterized protein YukE
MGELKTDKRMKLADGLDRAIQNMISRAAESGKIIWTGEAVRELQSSFPDSDMSPAELVEAVVRAAAARGLAVAFQKADEARPNSHAAGSGPPS